MGFHNSRSVEIRSKLLGVLRGLSGSGFGVPAQVLCFSSGVGFGLGFRGSGPPNLSLSCSVSADLKATTYVFHIEVLHTLRLIRTECLKMKAQLTMSSSH